MGLEYIRKTYNVPARRGVKVRYTSGIPGTDPMTGHITSARGGSIMVKFNSGRPYRLHPNDDGLVYLAVDGEVKP